MFVLNFFYGRHFRVPLPLFCTTLRSVQKELRSNLLKWLDDSIKRNKITESSRAASKAKKKKIVKRQRIIL